MLTLTLKIGDTVRVGGYRVELRSSTSRGYAVISCQRLEPEEGPVELAPLQQEGAKEGEGTTWHEVCAEPRTRVGLSRNSRPRPSNCKLTFDAPRSVDIWRE